MVNAGSTATYTVSVSGIYDFDGSVALAATGLAPGATVSINPSAVTVTGSTPTTATLTIVTASSQAKLVPTDRLPHGGLPPSVRISAPADASVGNGRAAKANSFFAAIAGASGALPAQLRRSNGKSDRVRQHLASNCSRKPIQSL